MHHGMYASIPRNPSTSLEYSTLPWRGYWLTIWRWSEGSWEACNPVMNAFLVISSGETSQMVGNYEMRGRWFQRINCTCTPALLLAGFWQWKIQIRPACLSARWGCHWTESIGTPNIIPGIRLNLKVGIGPRHEVRKSVVATLPSQHGSLSDRLLVGSFCMCLAWSERLRWTARCIFSGNVQGMYPFTVGETHRSRLSK